MRSRILNKLAFSLCLLTSLSSFAFNYSGLRWNLNTESPTICWVVDEDTLPSSVTMTVSEINTQIEAGLNMWEGVTTSFIDFDQCCSVPSSQLILSGTGCTRIVVEDNLGAAGFAGCQGWSTVEGQEFCSGGQIKLNSSMFDGSHNDSIQFVVAHEMGHVMGLLHSDRPSIMSYHKGSATLTNDDWAAVTYLYPLNGTREEYNNFGCASVRSPNSTPGGPWNLLVLGLFFVLHLLRNQLRRIRHYMRKKIVQGLGKAQR